jgi:male-specific lethal 1
MISYQWGSKEVVLRVKSFLEKNRVSCWIDLDNIKGSTLQAMAEAVECSDIFLMCYSFKYFTSKNCRQGKVSVYLLLTGAPGRG